jgi:hypothetical protein
MYIVQISVHCPGKFFEVLLIEDASAREATLIFLVIYYSHCPYSTVFLL